MISTTTERRRRLLRWTIAATAALPTLTAAQQILQGANGTADGPTVVSPTVDGELRYANTFKLAVGPIIWSHLDDVETSPVVTAALGTIIVGGGARLLSWHQRGRPHAIAVVATGLEVLVLPAVLLWRKQIAHERRSLS